MFVQLAIFTERELAVWAFTGKTNLGLVNCVVTNVREAFMARYAAYDVVFTNVAPILCFRIVDSVFIR